MNGTSIDGMDQEWLTLILEAKELGISMESVREFLRQSEQREVLVKNG